MMMVMMMIELVCVLAGRAEKIVNIDDEPPTESTQKLVQQLADCRAKCYNNLAAAQMKVFFTGRSLCCFVDPTGSSFMFVTILHH